MKRKIIAGLAGIIIAAVLAWGGLSDEICARIKDYIGTLVNESGKHMLILKAVIQAVSG